MHAKNAVAHTEPLVEQMEYAEEQKKKFQKNQ